MMLYKLISSLPKDEFNVTVVSLSQDGDLEDCMREAGSRVVTLGMSRRAPDPFALYRLWRIIKESSPHVVQTWLYHADLVGYLVARLAGVPAIAWNIRCSDMGDSYYRGLSGLVVRILAMLSPHPNAIIVNSVAGMTCHEARGYNSTHWRVIPNGFDLEKFCPDPLARVHLRRELGVPDDTILIGLVARFDPVKGHGTFLRAAEILSEPYPNCRFVLVGRGCDTGNFLLTSLISRSMQDRVMLLGHRNDIAHLTAALDIATCASTHEGFPNTVGEAMACGTACVVTNVGDSADIVADTGLTIPSDDPSAMADAWRKLVEGGTELRYQLGSAARRRVREYYGLSQVTETYAQLYRDLAAKPFPRTLS